MHHNPISEAAMSSAEFRCLREFLGLSPEWLAEHLDVQERTVHRWSTSDTHVPEGVAERMRLIARDTAAYVSTLARTGGTVFTYRNDAQFLRSADISTLPTDHRHHASIFPASWHRAVAARVLDAQSGVTIDYAAQVPGTEMVKRGVDPAPMQVIIDEFAAEMPTATETSVRRELDRLIRRGRPIMLGPGLRSPAQVRSAILEVIDRRGGMDRNEAERTETAQWRQSIEAAPADRLWAEYTDQWGASST